MIKFHGNISVSVKSNVLENRISKAQKDFTNQIMIDCNDYVPFRQGILSNSVHVENDKEIVWNGPYARFLYYGKVMVDERGSTWARKGGKKHVIDRDLKYSKEGHLNAGSFWFERAKKVYQDNWIKLAKKAVK
jgi:hypothetical protein